MKLTSILCERPSKTIYRDGDKVIYLYNESYSKGDILNAALNQARVEEIGISLPKVLEVTKIDGRWAIISEFIEGVTLEQMMRDNPQSTDTVLEKFALVQNHIHSFRCRKLTSLRDKMLGKIAEADISDNVRYELETRIEGMPKHQKLCHGDLMPSDVIIKPDGTPVVLDWSHATQGNASADAARTYMLFCLENSKELADRYMTFFCKISGLPFSGIQRWLPIVAASQSVKNIPGQRELLMSWVNIAEYQ